MADSGNEPGSLIRPAWLASAVLLGAAGLLAMWLRSGLIGSEQWPIRWLDVHGDLERTTAGQIRAAVASEAQAGFFAVELEAIRDRVEALPWIARAEVSRQWPDALAIEVVEHRPVARWNEHGLFSDRGEVFRVDGSAGMQGLARLSGPESMRQQVRERWQAMRSRLESVGRDIASLSVDERGAWELVLDNGLRLVLGREQVDQRLERYVGVHAALRDLERPMKAVDMRYTNGLAVRWADEERTGDETGHG